MFVVTIDASCIIRIHIIGGRVIDGGIDIGFINNSVVGVLVHININVIVRINIGSSVRSIGSVVGVPVVGGVPSFVYVNMGVVRAFVKAVSVRDGSIVDFDMFAVIGIVGAQCIVRIFGNGGNGCVISSICNV